MRPKSLVLLLLALGCGLVASIGINQVLANRRAQPDSPRGETDAIFVAIADVDTWEPLSVQNVKLEDWPRERIPAGAIKTLDNLDGRRVRTKIYQGEPILEAKLLSPGASKTGATGLIPKGFRAVSVRVDSVSGGSGLILPNDRVDVLVHIKSDPARGIGQTVTRTILQDVQVFAINEVFRNEEKEAEESAIAAKTITLLVTPQDAELITLATELGKIRLVMRSPEDDEASATEGALANDLLNNEAHKGDRDDESLMQDNEPASKDELAGFLHGQRQPTAADTAAAQPTP
ncbi:MAG: Flp pilus assembly protein CpaB, partial [Pirellulales bacterium]|nr:Flp pilus assembly protein CpaB [Pirellulales bacterium]